MGVKDLFSTELKVVNIGLPSFKESLDDVGTKAVQVDWKPPIEVSEEAWKAVQAHGADIAAANERAMDIILRGMPQLIGLDVALDVIPGMNENLFLHAGPPRPRKPRSWRRRARSSSRPATSTRPWGRWQALSRHRCPYSSSRTMSSGTTPTAP